MEIKRSSLESALKAVAAGVENKCGGSAIGAYSFKKNFVASSDGNVAVIAPIETGVEGAVKAKELLGVISKMKGDVVEIESEDDKVFFDCGTTELEMTTIQEAGNDVLDSVMGLLGKVKKKDWKALPEGFISALELCSFSMGADTTTGALCGIGFFDTFMLSSDNLRLSAFDLGDSMAEVVIPREAVAELVRLPDLSDWMTDKETGWMFFQDKAGLIFATRCLAGDFPAEKILELLDNFGSSESDKLELPDGVLGVLDRVKEFLNVSATGRQYITIKIEDGEMIFEGKTEFGNISDGLEVDKDFPKIEILISPTFLKSILDLGLKTFSVENDGNILFFSSDSHPFRYAVSLIKKSIKEKAA